MQICKFCKSAVLLLLVLAVVSPAVRGQSGSVSNADADFLYAEKLSQDQYIDLAIEQYKQFISKYPQEARVPLALRRIGESSYELGNYADARAAFEKLVLSYPADKQAADAMYWIGKCFAAVDSNRAAAKAFEHYARLWPSADLAPAAFLQAADLYFRTGDRQRGRKLAYEVIDSYAKDENARAQAHYLLLQDFFQAGEYDRAFELANAFLQKFSEVTATPEVWFLKGKLHARMGQFLEAEKCYSTVLQRFPGTDAAKRAGIERAKLAFALGRKQQAHEQLTALTTGGDDSLTMAAVFLDGRFYLQEGRPEAAIERLGKQRNNAYFIFRHSALLGQAYAQNRDYDAALQAFNDALADDMLQDDSLRVAILLSAARSAFSGNNAEEAERFLRRARDLGPPADLQPELLFLQARVAMQGRNDPARASRWFADFIEKYPEHPKVDEAQMYLALSYEALQDWLLARAEWQRLIGRYPASAHYGTARQHLVLIEAYRAPELADLAVQLAGTAVNAVNPQPELTRAQILIQFRAYEQAIPVLKQIIAGSEDGDVRARAVQMLASAYFARGEMAFLQAGQHSSAWFDSARVALRLLQQMHSEGIDRAAADLQWAKMAQYSGEAGQMARVDSLCAAHPDDSAFDRLRLQVLKSQVAATGLPRDSTTLPAVQRSLQEIARRSPDLANEAALLSFKLALARADTAAALAMLADMQRKEHLDPAYVQTELLRAQILASTGAADQAKWVLQDMSSRYFYSPVADSARLLLAKLELKTGNVEKALQQLMNLQTRLRIEDRPTGDPVQAESLFLLARANEAAGDRLGASRYYLQFLDAQQEDTKQRTDALFALAEISQKLHTTDLSKLYLQEIIDSGADPQQLDEAKVRLAELLYDQREYKPARALALEVIRSTDDPGQQRRGMRVAVLSGLRQGNLSSMESEIKVFASTFPDAKATRAEIEYEKGELYLRQKNFRQAEKAFKGIRKKYKDTEYAIRGELGMGKALLIQNKAEEALDILADVPRRYPNHPLLRLVYLNLGEFYAAQRQAENAIGALQKVLADSLRDHTEKLAMRKLIEVYEGVGLFDRALMYCRQYLATFPNDDPDLNLRIKIGSLLRELGQYNEAIAQYRTLQPLAVGDAEAEIQYFIGESYFQSGQFEKASVEFLRLKYYSKPTKLNWRTTALYKAGISNMRLQRYDRAKELFELVIRQEGADSGFGRYAKQRILEIEQAQAQQGRQSHRNRAAYSASFV